MQYTYTAVITEKDGTFYAKVPDVDGCITTAPTLTEAIALITDALNLCLVGLEDEEITPNAPTPQAEISHLPTDILTIIQADTIKYRSMTDTKAVRKMFRFRHGCPNLPINVESTVQKYCRKHLPQNFYKISIFTKEVLPMSHPIQSEAHLTTFEAISMIVGNSIGTGIIAVPYLATKNSMLDVVWMVLIAYCVNVILHLIIAELSYNNGGVQLVKSFEGELFHGKMKQIFSWSVFIVYGLAIMIGVSGNINGGAQIFVNWFGMPFVAAQVLYYVLAGVVVFIGMKAVGIAQKYAVIVLMGIVAVMTVGTFLHPLNSLQRAQFHWNNLLALYSMVVFATSANQAVIQVVKGLDGNAKQIRRSIFIGFGLSSVFVLIVTGTVLLGTKGALEKELAYMQLGESIGTWAMILAGVFSLFALLTTFWSNTLALRDVVHEQIGSGNRISWLIATVPCILFAVFGVNSFIVLTRIMSGVVVLVSIMLVLTYGKSRKKPAAVLSAV